MWIESHQSLGSHPKTIRLARLLGCSVPQAIGHLHLLWWWAIDYAPDGDLTGYDPADIARVCQWEGDPQVFIDALLRAGRDGRPGFLEHDGDRLIIHDWWEYAGRLLQRRERDKQRYRRLRQTRRVAKEQEKPEAREANACGTRAAREDNMSSTAGERVENRGNLYQPTNLTNLNIDPPPISPPPKPIPRAPSARAPKGGKSDPYTAEFLDFWTHYPRHIGKREAFEKWKTRLKETMDDGTPITPALLIQAAKNYAEECRRERREARYIKHPSTFLGPKHPFADYVRQPNSPKPVELPAFITHKELFGGRDSGDEAENGGTLPG